MTPKEMFDTLEIGKLYEIECADGQTYPFLVSTIELNWDPGRSTAGAPFMGYSIEYYLWRDAYVENGVYYPEVSDLMLSTERSTRDYAGREVRIKGIKKVG